MHARRKFIRQSVHNLTVLRQTAETVKMAGRDSDPEMRFPAFPPAGVTLMAVTFIDDLEIAGRECGGQFGNDRIANGHVGS